MERMRTCCTLEQLPLLISLIVFFFVMLCLPVEKRTCSREDVLMKTPEGRVGLTKAFGFSEHEAD